MLRMDMARRLILTCITVMLTDQASFVLVSLSTAILALAARATRWPGRRC